MASRFRVEAPAELGDAEMPSTMLQSILALTACATITHGHGLKLGLPIIEPKVSSRYSTLSSDTFNQFTASSNFLLRAADNGRKGRHADMDKIIEPETEPILWVVPLANELNSFTFRGTGNGRTAQFTLKSDAALRIIAEGGPFRLTVIKADGTPLPTVASQPDGGLGLMEIPDPGTYEMIIEASGRWGVTVVFQK